MAFITLRESAAPTIPGSTTVKGSALTNLQVDANFVAINTELTTASANIVTLQNAAAASADPIAIAIALG